MKVGDLVTRRSFAFTSGGVGIIMRTFEHKLWRTEERGRMVDFASISTEPFAEVVFGGGHSSINIPVSDLEVISENA
jgi:hypothetical protein